MPRTAPAEPLPDRLPPVLLRPGLPQPVPGSVGAQAQVERHARPFRLARDGQLVPAVTPGRNCSDQFPELAPLADALRGREVLLDGELVYG